jgi:hypothetical protein
VREIKFRGKPTNNGEWVYGDYTRLQVPLSDEVVHYIVVNLFSPVEVKPETVGQYVGEIFWGDGITSGTIKLYEGDIVDITFDGETGRYVVIWDEDETDFKATKNGIKESYGNKFHYLAANDCVEKVGNIHDNPELLEV